MHSFYQYVIDAEALVKSQTLKGFNKELARQANTDEAVAKYQVLNRLIDEDYGQFRSPLYYGGGVEFLAESYLDFFDSNYNLKEIVSMDDWDNPQRDRGSDHHAVSAKKEKYKTQGVISQPGSPVRIQTKGTLNSTKEHMTNDGSRIMNFVGSSLAEACKSQTAYSMRLILFTLGKGLHYRLEDNIFKKIEVINSSEISKKIDKNPFFWNHMRKRFGLPILDIAYPKDPEGNAIKMELDELDT
jgi:hypothetical protein